MVTEISNFVIGIVGRIISGVLTTMVVRIAENLLRRTNRPHLAMIRLASRYY